MKPVIQAEGKRTFGRVLMKKISALILAAFLIPAMQGCGSKPDISAYQETPVMIKGLTEEGFEITPAELIKMECYSESGTGDSDKAGTVEGYGPTLDTFLAAYGKERGDFAKIKFTAKDGYQKTVFGKMLEEKEIVLSVANGEDSLADSETPMRLLIPGAESSYWVYGVTEIEFIP